MIGPSGLLLVIPHIFAVPVSVGLQKSTYITKLGCEKIFLQGHILSTAGDALRLPHLTLKLTKIILLLLVVSFVTYYYDPNTNFPSLCKKIPVFGWEK
jgi:hypothetical protein